MTPPRPSSITAAAVMAIIYGGLLTVCGLCGVAGLANRGGAEGNFFGDPRQQEVQKKLEELMEQEAPAYRSYQGASTFFSLAEAVGLLVAGIELLKVKRWARTLALTMCCFGIATTLIQAIYQGVFVLPIVSEFFQNNPNILVGLEGPAPEDAAQIMKMVVTMITVVGIIFSLLLLTYLVIIVILLTRRQARAAFEDSGYGDTEPTLPDEGRDPYEY
jgi:hypothetical protein